MTTIAKREIIQKAGDLLMVEASKLEGISGALTALASDQDGLSLVSKHHRMRALELLADACDQAVIRLGVVYSMIEAIEGEAVAGQGGDDAKP